MGLSLVHLPEAHRHPRELARLRRHAAALGLAGPRQLAPPRDPLAPGGPLLRDLVVAGSDERALELWGGCGLVCGRRWHDAGAAARTPALFEEGLALVGGVATVRGQLAALRARAPHAELRAWVYPGRMPLEEILRSLTLFAERVLRAPRRRRC